MSLYPPQSAGTGGGDSFSMRARAARLRVGDPQLDPESARVLAQQQYTEQETARQTAGTGAALYAQRNQRPTPGLYPSTSNGPRSAPGAVVLGLYANSGFERAVARSMAPATNLTPPPTPNLTINGRRFAATEEQAASGAFAAPSGPTMTGTVSAGPGSAPGLFPQSSSQPSALSSQPSPSLPVSPAPPLSSLPHPPSFAPGSVDELMFATGKGPARGLYDLNRQQTMDQASLAGHASTLESQAVGRDEGRAHIESIHAQNDRNARNAKAWAAAVKASGDPEADPVQVYQQAMGDDVSHITALRKEKPFTPGFVDSEKVGGPAGGTVFQQSPNSAQYIAEKVPKATFPREVTAGGRKMIEVATGKFTDDKGTPIEWRDGQEKPLTVNEFMMSPVLGEKFGNDYGKYREAHAAMTKTVRAPGAAPGAAAGAPSLADVQAEIARRKAGKK